MRVGYELIWERGAVIEYSLAKVPPVNSSDSARLLAGTYRLPVVAHREAELAELEHMLTGPKIRLLTLTGTAGIGKSSLAREALQAGSFRDRRIPMADLAGAADRQAAWRIVLETIAPHLAAERSAGEADASVVLREVERTIGPVGAILLLDNCDPVVGAISRDIARLLQRCPQLTVVATTRVPLNLHSECVFCVVPLPAGDPAKDCVPASSPASQLLLQSIDSHYRGSVTIADQLVLDEIARALDGVPLALELAAATIARVGAVRTLRLIEAGGDLESARFVDTPKRHRTLYDAVNWGLDALSAPARALLLRLSLCTAAVDRSTAHLLGGTDAEATADALAELVNHSLLHYRSDEHGNVTFALIATVRAWCRRTLASDRARARRLRYEHAERMAELADTLGLWLRRRDTGRTVPETAARLAHDFLGTIRQLGETGRLDAAVRLAAVLEDVWIQLGLLGEVELLVSGVLVAPTEDRPGTAHRRCLELLGRWSLRAGRAHRAVDLLTESAAACRRSGDRDGERRVAAVLAEALRRIGRRSEAEAQLRSAAESPEPGFETYSRAIALTAAMLALPAPPNRSDTEWVDLRDRIQQIEREGVRLAAINALARTQLSRDTAGRAVQLFVTVLGSQQADRCLLETIGALEGCAQAYAFAGAEHAEAAATLWLAARQLRARHGIPQLEGDDTLRGLTEGRELLGEKGFRDIMQNIADMDLPEVIAYARAIPALPDDNGSSLAVLTPRQREIAELVATGMTNRMIASHLGLSEWTVVNHLRQVMVKLDCPSRLHVALVVERESQSPTSLVDTTELPITPQPDTYQPRGNRAG
ncbi:hypothetical protein CRH09_04625 [Nocardia terpenica]|uniref:HTH luxR-type domain-containing protein n=1 Tax=Nocardia terpenica TaxID=455432 RepID=A0A291RDC5_9NOCA|nr:hypothetical protein CRH09_04625 [Nocardia terpenica]